MTGVIRIQWKDEEVRAAIKRMRHHRGTWKPVFDNLKQHLRRTLRAYARQEKGLDGRWPRRAAATADRYEFRTSQRKRLAGGKAGPVQRKLVRRRSRKLLGKLPSAVTIKARKGGIAAISKVPWSAAHNDGARTGRGAVLPKRDFVFISPAFAQIAVDRMAEYAVREFGR